MPETLSDSLFERCWKRLSAYLRALWRRWEVEHEGSRLRIRSLEERHREILEEGDDAVEQI